MPPCLINREEQGRYHVILKNVPLQMTKQSNMTYFLYKFNGLFMRNLLDKNRRFLGIMELQYLHKDDADAAYKFFNKRIIFGCELSAFLFDAKGIECPLDDENDIEELKKQLCSLLPFFERNMVFQYTKITTKGVFSRAAEKKKVLIQRIDAIEGPGSGQRMFESLARAALAVSFGFSYFR